MTAPGKPEGHCEEVGLMAHDHSHGDRNAYYLDQLFTIAVCAALGGVCVMLWYSGKVKFMLDSKFFIWVLLGGLTLLALVLIRALALWQSVDEAAAAEPHDHHHHDHDHDHNHDHGHDHPHSHDHSHGHDHSHDHGHEHGWAPWRYVVLLLPVVLFLLNLPNQGFSGGTDISEQLGVVPNKLGQSKGKTEIGFAQLQQASLTEESRDFYEGRTITLVGKYLGSHPKRFTLERYKIACCAADAVKLDAVIMIDPDSPEKLDPDVYRNQWVKVTGRIHFFNRPNTREFLTALILYPTTEDPLDKLAEIIPPPSSPWVN
jgi:hypothetical protein